MLRFKNLTLKNFLSVGGVTQAVDLNDTPLTLVLGENTDTNGTTSRNGAGKSTILQAISYALYGKPLTRIKIPNLINNINGNQMLVTLEFEKGDKVYRIERGKKPDVMRFSVNGVEFKAEERVDETHGENEHTQIEINRQVNMSHELFKLILALNTFSDPFLKQETAKQRNIMEELFGTQQMSYKANALADEIKNTKRMVDRQQDRIKALTDANEHLLSSIRVAEEKAGRWEEAHEAKIASLTADLEAIATLDFESELRTFDAFDAFMERKRALDQEITEANSNVRLCVSEVTSLTNEMGFYEQQAKDGATKQVERLLAEALRASQTSLRHMAQHEALTLEAAELERAPQDGSCSLCGQSIEGTHHHAEMQAKLAKRIADLHTRAHAEAKAGEERKAEAAQIEAEADRLLIESEDKRKDFLAKALAVSERLEQTKAKLANFNESLDRLKADQQKLGNPPEPLFSSRDELYQTRQEREKMAHVLETELETKNPYLTQVSDLNAAVQPIVYDELNMATDLLKHQEFLLKLLKDKNSFIRKKLMDQNLLFVNQQLSRYLDKLYLPHTVTFKSDLSVDIDLLGRDFDFEQLSRGEMNRVIMAMSWAFRDVWESMNETCNLLWVDELLDQGTDAQGVEAALSILTEMTRSGRKNIFLISHRDELQSRIDRTLLVRKDNGFTTFDGQGL